MRTRSSPKQMEAGAVAALRSAVSAVGLETRQVADDRGADVIVRSPDGSSLSIDIKAAAVPTADWVAKLEGRTDQLMIVVADQIPTGIREDLNDRRIGWLDRRGHLRLVSGSIFIDADVPLAERIPSSTTTRPAISGRSGLAAATALLMRPDEPTAVGEVADAAGMNASSISRAMATLADAQLAERLSRGQYRPLAPELFWALADVWPRTRTPVQLTLEELDDPRLTAHVDDLETTGWAIGGERGAVGWGAPLVLTGDYPTLLYVPDDESIRRAKVLGGETGPNSDTRGRPSVELAVDPVGLLTHNRYASNAAGAPLTHPAVCALDLAATSRGREALEQWDPPEGFVRVW